MGAILNAPIILDVGKASRKKIRGIKQGRGKLMGDVEDAMAEVTASLGEQAEGKQLVPVVLVYEKKRKGNRTGGFIPFLS